MKKIVLIYAGILVGLYVVLSVLGSSGEYAVEQQVWNIHKRFTDIRKDPSVVPEKAFDEVAHGYERVIKRHPKSKLVPGLRFLVGRVYEMKKDYDTARKKFYALVDQYPGPDMAGLRANALVAVAGTFMDQKNWPAAKKVYDRVLEEYPLTQAGLGIPVFYANYYRTQNDYAKTIEFYDKAIAHYTQLTKDHPNSMIAYSSFRYLSNCYLEQKRWAEALDTLGKVLADYGNPQYMTPKTADMIVKTINVVATYQLKDYDAAIRIYERILAQNPNHPLGKYLKKDIDSFNLLKEKGVAVTKEK